jgi:hypothetical protein
MKQLSIIQELIAKKGQISRKFTNNYVLRGKL